MRSKQRSSLPLAVVQTVEFCRGLEAAGCALVAVHGRKRGSPQARRSGAADLQAIKAVKESLRIPVVSALLPLPPKSSER